MLSFRQTHWCKAKDTTHTHTHTRIWRHTHSQAEVCLCLVLAFWMSRPVCAYVSTTMWCALCLCVCLWCLYAKRVYWNINVYRINELVCEYTLLEVSGYLCVFFVFLCVGLWVSMCVWHRVGMCVCVCVLSCMGVCAELDSNTAGCTVRWQ